ncbi:MAG: bifunctional polysaccharide deacetylase/glycosyltransferase family 2 protein [Dermatophilaceae bacterium]
MLAILVAAVVVVLVAYATVGLRPPSASAHQVGTMTAAEIGDEPAVIGAGPLERIVRIDRSGDAPSAVDPFTGDRFRLSAADLADLGQSDHAVQRFGYAEGTRKTISLTFDDGPDASVTPTLLDVLSRERVPATFFLVGRNVVHDPAIVERIGREGHALGVHTMTHPHLSDEPDWRERAEIVQTERLLRHITGHAATMWRMPYAGPDVAETQDAVPGVVRAQALGYTHASYDFDSLDWMHDANPHETANDIPLPDFSTGDNITALLHDAGGPNRMRTVAYVERVVAAAKANGYTFTTMPQANTELAAANAPVTTDVWDTMTFYGATAAFDWPDGVMKVLFGLALLVMIGFGALNTALAVARYRRRRSMVWPHPLEMGVSTSVVLAAYNEAAVIRRTLTSVLASTYPIREVVVVDDGSSDGTSAVVAEVAAKDPRVVLVIQENTGKSIALNRGIEFASGDVVVTIDADTLVQPDTVVNLVRHFAVDEDGRLGGVAGVVRVGNRTRNLLTRWQALEYVTQIGLDRSAQDALGAISIIPGACAAWRKEAIVAAGGYSHATLAEDCDLALTLHRMGWRVTQDDEAVADTEAPETVDDLLKQRSRWTYGTLQAMYKHRRMMFRGRYGFLGWFVLPTYVASILIPLVFLPFVAVMAVQTVQVEGPAILVQYFLIFLAAHLVMATVAVRLMGQSWRLLLMVPIYRLVFEPLRAYLLYTSVARAIKGGRMAWNKLDRSGFMDDSNRAGLEPDDPRLDAVPALEAGAR